LVFLSSLLPQSLFLFHFFFSFFHDFQLILPLYSFLLLLLTFFLIFLLFFSELYYNSLSFKVATDSLANLPSSPYCNWLAMLFRIGYSVGREWGWSTVIIVVSYLLGYMTDLSFKIS
jgi:hypothetical protein